MFFVGSAQTLYIADIMVVLLNEERIEIDDNYV